jgi:hypothetical protein
MTKREWQIEMANRFAKRDNVNTEELDTRSYLLGRYDSTKTLTDEEIRKAVEAEREACAKICDLAMLQNQEAINELENDEHIAKCFIYGAMNQLVKTAKAIRSRGQE